MNRIDKIEVIPSGGALGAKVCGIDLSRELSTETIEELTDIWATHLVLLLRNQELDDGDLLRFSHYLGGPQASGRIGRKAPGILESDKSDSSVAMVTYVSNLNKEGEAVNPVHTSGSSELCWHSDNSYVRIPPKGTMLWADVIPDDGSGQTAFCNLIQAYEELPGEVKTLIEGKHTIQDGSRNLLNQFCMHREQPRSIDDIDGPEHPMVRTHPPTGKRALYLGRRSDYPSTYIVEMPNSEGEAVLDLLWAHATQDKYVWTHSWNRGDFLLWDNRAVMHRRTAINPTQARLLHRLLIKGEPVIPAWTYDSAAK